MRTLLLAVMLLNFYTALFAKDNFYIDKDALKKAELKYGYSVKKRLTTFIALLNELEDKDDIEKLNKINDYFNKITYNTDLVIWNQKDYWASREEFIGMGSGDCEDYTIAKYFSLKQLGFSDKTIFLTYVKAIKYNQAHMVLTYFKTPDSTPLVLDNINPKILPANKRRDLHPLFNFNGEKIYMAKQRGLGEVVPDSKLHLDKWSELILKIKHEKLEEE